MHDRTGWIKGTSGTKVLKGRTYKDLTEFSRPCATCNQPFSIFVTSKIAMGHADSNSFGLKNCEDHRKNKTAAQSDETDALRMANRVMKEELAGLYDRDRNQFAEIQALKAKLAGYELQGAMLAADPYLQLGLGPREKPGTATAQKKMPFEPPDYDAFDAAGTPDDKMPWE